MAIEVTEGWTNATTDYDIAGRRARRTFDVTGTDSPFTALAQPEIPVLNDPHPSDSNLRVSRVGQPQRIGPQYFRVEAEYRQGTQIGVGNDVDPISRLPVYQWNIGLATERFDRDVDGNPIVNSAGDPFGDGVEATVHSITLDVTRNEASFSPIESLNYTNKVNAGSWTVAGVAVGEGQAKCLGIAPVNGYTLADNYVSIRYSFEFREDGFLKRILDEGIHGLAELEAGTGIKKVSILVEGPDGQIPAPSPQLLNGKGVPLSDRVVAADGMTFTDGETPAGATVEATADAVFLKYKSYKAVDFTPLNL